MKSLFGKVALLAVLLVSPFAESAVAGVSLSVGEPGFFGQIDIGNAPPPRLIYTDPVIVRRTGGWHPAPIYLHIPPGHVRHWNRYCYEYNACGRPVYFVEPRWYDEVYVPHYRRHYREHRYEHYNGREHHYDRDYDRGPRR